MLEEDCILELPIVLLLFPDICVFGVITDHFEDSSRSSHPYSLANALSIADFEALENSDLLSKSFLNLEMRGECIKSINCISSYPFMLIFCSSYTLEFPYFKPVIGLALFFDSCK
jgi:hypothetical protein